VIQANHDSELALPAAPFAEPSATPHPPTFPGSHRKGAPFPTVDLHQVMSQEEKISDVSGRKS
jgi:hypothetical protein